MKKILILTLLLALSPLSFAASKVVFPVNNQEVKAYPGKAEIQLGGKNGMHFNVAYAVTCHIINPSKEIINVQTSLDPYPVIYNPATLNGKQTGTMLHLAPGTNTFVQPNLSIYSDAKLIFANYDNDISVFVKDCSATLE